MKKITPLKITLVLLICSVLFALTSQFGLFNHSSQPLLNDPSPQLILNSVKGYTGPTIRFGQDLKVMSVKCSNASKPITVTGSFEWATTDPRGTSVAASSGSSMRKPGCIDFSYSDPMPKAVIDRTNALMKQGYSKVLWHISGSESSGGSIANYYSEDFLVIP